MNVGLRVELCSLLKWNKYLQLFQVHSLPNRDQYTKSFTSIQYLDILVPEQLCTPHRCGGQRACLQLRRSKFES